MVAVKELSIISGVAPDKDLEYITEVKKTEEDLEIPDDKYRYIKSIPPARIDGTKEYLTIQYKAVDRFKFQQELILGREMTSNETAVAWATSGSATKFREQYCAHYEKFVKICETNCHHECKGAEKCCIPPLLIQKAFGIKDKYKNIDYCDENK